MIHDNTTSRTIVRGDASAQTRVHTTSVRGGYEPPVEEEARPRFLWGMVSLPSIKHSNKQAKAKRHAAIEPSRDEYALPARTVTTFTSKLPNAETPSDSVINLSARVAPNTRTMYSPSEYNEQSRLSGKPAEPSVTPIPPVSEVADASPENFRPLRFGERMLRNTAVCVAILLCALAIRTIDAPIARTVSTELRDWVTMDLDESLGSLKFVQNLLPDAALVFWHIGAAQTFTSPSEAVISHSWSEAEPYIAYASGAQHPVYAAASGEVADISYIDDANITVRLRHDDGMETVYGRLNAVTVREGDTLSVSDVIGAAETLFFEIRGEGRSMNPAPLLANQLP